MDYQILLCTLCLLCSFTVAEDRLQGFKNGQTFVITSAATGKVFTAGTTGNFTKSSPVLAATWNEEAGQKWLALEAPNVIQTSPTAREVQSTRFYLIPHRQLWDWSSVTKNEGNITSPRNLPPFTEVLALDSVTGNLTTEVFKDGSSSQTWIPEDGGEGQIFIRNLGNNQCVKNFDYKPSSLIQKLFSFIRRIRKHQKHVPNSLSTLDCSPKDVSQKWLAET